MVPALLDGQTVEINSLQISMHQTGIIKQRKQYFNTTVSHDKMHRSFYNSDLNLLVKATKCFLVSTVLIFQFSRSILETSLGNKLKLSAILVSSLN